MALNSGTGDWTHLWEELYRRTREPAKYVPFVAYFLIGIVVCGALGIWIELVKLGRASGPPELTGLITAVLTFFPALIGSTSIQFVFVIAGKERVDMTLIAFTLVTLIVSFGLAVLLAVFSASHPQATLFWGAFLSVGAAWVWWVATCDDRTFRKQPPIDAATGGDTNRSLAGNTAGFKT